MRTLLLVFLTVAAQAQQLSEVRRVCVENLSGDRSAVQIRDMIIAALQQSKVFALTEDPTRADAVLRGSAEDLIYTETHQTSEGLTARAGGSSSGNRVLKGIPSISVGEHENSRITERRHEANAAVRLVNRSGDVLWSTTQESAGGKFRSASADVADRVARQLVADLERARRGAPSVTSPAPPSGPQASPPQVLPAKP